MFEGRKYLCPPEKDNEINEVIRFQMIEGSVAPREELYRCDVYKYRKVGFAGVRNL